MSYEIKYDGPDADKKAIKDIKSFIGKGKRWELLTIIVSASIASGSRLPAIEMMCGFAGIQGYPVQALCRYICKISGCDLPEGVPSDEQSR